MFPSQTSLIPITVALARFLEANGSGGLYPYWYLSTTPFKYLTGPVVSYLMVGLRTILPPGFSFFELAFFLIFTSFFVQALGWGLFAYSLTGKKMTGWAVGVLTLILPWHLFSALGLGETSVIVAGALTPWVVLVFARGPVSSFPPVSARSKLKSGVNKNDQVELRAVGDPSRTTNPRKIVSVVSGQSSIVFPAVVFALLLLTNTAASVPAIVGMILISITNDKFQITKFKKVLAVIFLGWLMTLWWYSPVYWLTVWGAPGIGGKNVLAVLATFVNFMRSFLPVVVAVLVVFWKVKPKTVFEKFSLGWLVLFGSLTLFRFMADWDFWMDWTAWMGEVEVGMALLIAGSLSQLISGHVARSSHPTSSASSKSLVNQHSISGLRALDGTPSVRNSRKQSVLVVVFSIYLLGGWGLAIINRDFWILRAKINNTVEYKIADWFSNHLTIQPASQAKRGEQFNNSTIFLSGTTAFWLNSLVDVRQVRGGRDEGSVDLRWREAAWEVREGVDGSRSVEALKSLGVDFLVVHNDDSWEYYHDFKYPDKFEGLESLKKVYDDQGDVIYQIK